MKTDHHCDRDESVEVNMMITKYIKLAKNLNWICLVVVVILIKKLITMIYMVYSTIIGRVLWIQHSNTVQITSVYSLHHHCPSSCSLIPHFPHCSQNELISVDHFSGSVSFGNLLFPGYISLYSTNERNHSVLVPLLLTNFT